VSPRAICTQNARSRSRRTGGRPGDSITARPVNAAAQPGGRPIESTSIIEVLRPPIEPGQYTSWAFTDRAKRSGLVPSMGSIGQCYDGAMIESFWGRMQTELLNRKRWKTRIELANAIFDYLEIFHNRQRRHSALGMRTPIEFELLHQSAQPVA
jgi:transposase InsO family protein